MQKRAHACTPLQGLCASSCHWCSFKKKSTSLPRELSAIADLNPHRSSISALRAASELLWLPLQSRYILFCFSGTNLRRSAERSRTIWMRTVQGFYRNGTQAESPCQHSLTSVSYYRGGGVGGRGVHVIIATVNDYFLFFLSLSLVLLGKNTPWNSFFFHYKYINIYCTLWHRSTIEVWLLDVHSQHEVLFFTIILHNPKE